MESASYYRESTRLIFFFCTTLIFNTENIVTIFLKVQIIKMGEPVTYKHDPDIPERRRLNVLFYDRGKDTSSWTREINSPNRA